MLVASGVVRGKEAELSELQKYPLGSLLYHSRLSLHRSALHGGLADLKNHPKTGAGFLQSPTVARVLNRDRNCCSSSTG